MKRHFSSISHFFSIFILIICINYDRHMLRFDTRVDMMTSEEFKSKKENNDAKRDALEEALDYNVWDINHRYQQLHVSYISQNYNKLF